MSSVSKYILFFVVLAIHAAIAQASQASLCLTEEASFSTLLLPDNRVGMSGQISASSGTVEAASCQVGANTSHDFYKRHCKGGSICKLSRLGTLSVISEKYDATSYKPCIKNDYATDVAECSQWGDTVHVGTYKAQAVFANDSSKQIVWIECQKKNVNALNKSDVQQGLSGFIEYRQCSHP